jgi:hypothetical protein
MRKHAAAGRQARGENAINPHTAQPSVSSKVRNAVAVPMSTAHTTQEQTVAAAAISHIKKWSDNFIAAF